MDGAILAGIITAIVGSVPAVIGALALLRRATHPQSKALSALRSLWDWVEFNDLALKVPQRIRRSVLAVLEPDKDDSAGTHQSE